jgi:hypothetical protein
MDTRRYVRTDGEDPDGRLGLCIVDALAEAEGVDPTELGFCLHNHVDVSALVDLFGSASGRPRNGTVSFVVEEWLVVVDIDRDEGVEVSVESTRPNTPRNGHPVGSPERQCD